MARGISKYSNRIIFGNCVNGMKLLPSDCADVMICDPPEDLSPEDVYTGVTPKTPKHWDARFAEYWQATTLWVREARRLLAPQGMFWAFGRRENAGIISCIMRLEGLKITGEAILGQENIHCIWYNAGRRIYMAGKPSGWVERGDEYPHRTERFATGIITNSARRGGLCVIPFCRSGMECVAALKSGRRFVAFENDKSRFKKAEERLRGAMQ